MRELEKTKAFDDFFNSVSDRTQTKIEYIIEILITQKVISQKLVKHLTGTIFYELRISTENENRVLFFTLDNPNIIECERVLLLNGFIKKDTKDYKKQIQIAENILNEYQNGKEN